MSFWTGTGNPFKPYLEGPSQNKGRLFSLIHYIRPDINPQSKTSYPPQRSVSNFWPVVAVTTIRVRLQPPLSHGSEAQWAEHHIAVDARRRLT